MSGIYNVGLFVLASDRSIYILTRSVVITGFNQSLLVNWWSIEKNMVDVKILSSSYPNVLDYIIRLKYSISI